MSNNKKVIIGILLIVIIILGIILGFVYVKKIAPKKKATIYPITIDEMYSNVKGSSRIVKIRIIVETNNKKDSEYLEENKYLIRDISNNIIRATEEKDLVGAESQNKLQEKIKLELIKRLEIESICNIRFNDFVIQ